MSVKKYYVTIDDNGSTGWYKDVKCTIYHRENGPAFEWAGGRKEWYQNGQLHRTDGPALEWSDGRRAWYINGKSLSEAAFLAATQPVVEMTVADIEKLVGKRVKIIK